MAATSPPPIAPSAAPGVPVAPSLVCAWIPHCAGLQIDEVVVTEDGVDVQATTMYARAPCPRCATPSSTVHSRYTRTIADLPWGAARVVLHVSPRRFRCRNPACQRRIFCERAPQLTRVYGRQTHCLRDTREGIGFALGGRPGARITNRLHLGGSRMTLLRLVRAAPDPPLSGTGDLTDTADETGPRHLGVDDWAKRKGRTYGTLLIDLDRHCPVDVLPDRTAETLAAWLQAHPGTELITRDRAGAYAEGARQGAPGATQVADRWHVLANLRDALERLLTRHQAALTAAAVDASPPPASDARDTLTSSLESTAGGCDAGVCHATTSPLRAPSVSSAPAVPHGILDEAGPVAAGAGPLSAPSSAPTPPRVQRRRAVALQQARRDRRLSRYEAVVAQHAQGKSLRTIAIELHLSRATVARYVRASHAGGFPERQPRTPRRTPLTRFDAYLRARWAAGCHNALTLWRELQAQGYPGGKTTVRDYVQAWRTVPPARPGDASPTKSAAAIAARLQPAVPPSVREITWRLLRRPEELAADEQAYLDRLFRHCAELGVAHGLTQDFAALVRERHRWQDEPGALTSWVRVAKASTTPELGSFAAGVLRDWSAVQAALTTSWSNGQTEGQVNRLKMLKRQMYGRANFDLLRKRVLARC